MDAADPVDQAGGVRVEQLVAVDVDDIGGARGEGVEVLALHPRLDPLDRHHRALAAAVDQRQADAGAAGTGLREEHLDALLAERVAGGVGDLVVAENAGERRRHPQPRRRRDHRKATADGLGEVSRQGVGATLGHRVDAHHEVGQEATEGDQHPL